MSYHEAREIFVDCLQAVPLFDIETIQGSSWDEKVLPPGTCYIVSVQLARDYSIFAASG